MEYTVETTINKPIDRVVELFEDTDNYKHWQEGLTKQEILAGEKGVKGCRTALEYQMGKRNLAMTETLVTNNLPTEYTTRYDAKGVTNFVKSSFEKLDDNTTRYKADQEFQFDSIMMKLFGALMPGAFKKQSNKYMADFKSFVEGT